MEIIFKKSFTKIGEKLASPGTWFLCRMKVECESGSNVRYFHRGKKKSKSGKVLEREPLLEHFLGRVARSRSKERE